MTTELPTYEEAQALSMDPGNFIKIQEQHRPLESEIRIPDSPPPSWSPPRAPQSGRPPPPRGLSGGGDPPPAPTPPSPAWP